MPSTPSSRRPRTPAVERAEARMREAPPLAMFDYVYGDVPAEVLAQRAAFAQELEQGRR